jgi:hypothetical protein
MTTVLMAGWFAWMGWFIDGSLQWERLDTRLTDQVECEMIMNTLATARPELFIGKLRVCLPEGMNANDVPVRFDPPGIPQEPL